MKQSEAARGMDQGQGCGITLRVCAGLVAKDVVYRQRVGVVRGESGSSSGVQVGSAARRRSVRTAR